MIFLKVGGVESRHADTLRGQSQSIVELSPPISLALWHSWSYAQPHFQSDY